MLKLRPQDRIQIHVGDRNPVYTVVSIDNGSVNLESSGLLRIVSYAVLDGMYSNGKSKGQKIYGATLQVLPRRLFVKQGAKASIEPGYAGAAS